MIKSHIHAERARLQAMLQNPSSILYDFPSRFRTANGKLESKFLAKIRDFAFERTDIETAVLISTLLENFPTLRKKDICTVLNKPNQYVSRLLAMLDPKWDNVISSGAIQFASLLEHYRPLPEKQKAELRRLAEREKRALTSGDIRSAKARVNAEDKQAVLEMEGDGLPSGMAQTANGKQDVKKRRKNTWNSRLAQARTERGLSTAELAMGAGVSPTMITDWESGSITTIEAEHCLKLSIYLDKSPYWLMFGIPDTRKYVKRTSSD